MSYVSGVLSHVSRVSPDEEASDGREQAAGDQLEHAVEPDAHLVQNVVISRQLE